MLSAQRLPMDWMHYFAGQEQWHGQQYVMICVFLNNILVASVRIINTCIMTGQQGDNIIKRLFLSASAMK